MTWRPGSRAQPQRSVRLPRGPQAADRMGVRLAQTRDGNGGRRVSVPSPGAGLCQRLSEHLPSTSRAPPERQARLLVRPGSEPLPRDQTFLLLSREPAESRTAGQTDARAYIQGPWPTSTQTPSLRRTARVSPAVPVAFSPRAEGPDDATRQPEASRHSNVSSSTGANAADVPAVYRSGRACPC